MREAPDEPRGVLRSVVSLFVGGWIAISCAVPCSARQRAGDDDRSEFQDTLRQLDAVLKRRTHVLSPTVSVEDMTAARAEWPGPVIDLFLGLKTSEQLDAIATAGTDPLTSARRKCDVDFYSGLLALNTKSPEARASLERAAANCPANTLESVAAKLELSRM